MSEVSTLFKELEQKGAKHHPLFEEAVSAAHSRPAIAVSAPVTVRHAVLLTGEALDEREAEPVRAFAEENGYSIDLGHRNEVTMSKAGTLLKWERHTEFVSITLFDPETQVADTAKDAFDDIVYRLTSGDRRGELIAKQKIFVVTPESAEQLTFHLFPDAPSLVEVGVNAGANIVQSDLSHSGEEGVIYLVTVSDSPAERVGRLVQRLLEIETYRILAYLAVPLTQRFGGEIAGFDRTVNELALRAAQNPTPEEEAEILQTLTTLSAELQSLASAAEFRFAASAAYSRIVDERLDSMREVRHTGRSLLSSAVQRRLHPAIRSCQSLLDRQKSLSERISHITTLLRTRVDLTLQDQNAQVLRSIDERAHAQLRLQETVEGLSVVAITYYSLGIIGYILKGLTKIESSINTDLAMAVIAVPLGLLIYFGLHRARRHATKSGKPKS